SAISPRLPVKVEVLCDRLNPLPEVRDVLLRLSKLPVVTLLETIYMAFPEVNADALKTKAELVPVPLVKEDVWVCDALAPEVNANAVPEVAFPIFTLPVE